jgi:hypothetical protein
MERDAIVGHGVSMFVRESLMKRGDGETFTVCNGCGTLPIFNDAEQFYVCPLCDGPVEYSGKTANTLELIPPNKRSLATFSKIEMPYVVKLLEQEMSTYMNIGMRFLTEKYLKRLPKPNPSDFTDTLLEEFGDIALPDLEQEDISVPPETRREVEETGLEDDLSNMPPLERVVVREGDDENVPLLPSEDEELEAAMTAAAQQAASAVAASRGQEARRLAEATQRGIEAAVNESRPGATVLVSSSSALGVQPPPEPTAGLRPPPLAEGAYSEAPTQIQIVQQVPLLPAGTTVLGSAGPGGRPTLIVDTSSTAMGQQGLPALELPALARPANLDNRGSVANRSGTRRMPRNRNLPTGPGVFNQAQAAPSASAKVMVQKLG